MKLILATALILAASLAQANEGSFDVKQNDFKTLFNDARMGQPESTPWAGTFWPYSFNGTAAKVDDGQFVDGRGGESPMDVFDQIAGFKGKESATKWELANHTCKHIKDKESKESCEGWWGHCNGWAAAAIKEDEPRRAFKIGGVNVTSSHAKGILSEIWLSSDSLFAGESDKGEKLADGLKSGGWIDKPSSPVYKTFWDLSPRSFLLITTNYVGLKKTGVIIDRDPGEEVWNQPVVGYRLLPIEADAIRVEERGGKKIWAVPMKMKLYWSNDLQTPPGVLSKPLDVAKHTNDTDELEEDLPTGTKGETIYEARLLEFTLFFDSEVKVAGGGKKVVAAGRIVGDGIWGMQMNPRQYDEGDLKQSHPDFVWLPTNPILDLTNGYGNPFMVDKVVRKIFKGHQGGSTEPDDEKDDKKDQQISSFKVVFPASAFENLQEIDDVSVRRKLRRIFSRAGHKVSMAAEDVDVKKTRVALIATFPEGMTKKDLETVFAEAEMEVRSIEAAEG